MFKIDIDSQRRLVSITLAGLMDDAEARRYLDELQSRFVRTIGNRSYVLLVDTRQFSLQLQSVVALIAERIAIFPKATRIALVNGESLMRMQLKRLIVRDSARYFDTIEDALPWLLHQWPDCSVVDRLARAG